MDEVREQTSVWLASWDSRVNENSASIDSAQVRRALQDVDALLLESVEPGTELLSAASNMLVSIAAWIDEPKRPVQCSAGEALIWELAGEPALPTVETTGDVELVEITTELARSVIEGITVDKLETLARRDDFERVQQALRYAEMSGQDASAARERVERIVADRTADLVRDVAMVETLLGQARVALAIDDAQASLVLADLAAVNSRGSGAVGRSRRTVNRLQRQLETALESTVESRRQQIAGHLSEGRISTEQQRQLDRLLDSFDVRTVDEMLARLDEGVDLGTWKPAAGDFDQFFPGKVSAARALQPNVSLLRKIRERVDEGPFAFSEISGESSDLAERALTAWFELNDLMPSDRTIEKVGDLLKPVLRAIGIESDSLGRATKAADGRGRLWLDLTGVRTFGKALVPQLGSMLEGRIRVLVVFETPSADRIVELLREDRSGLQCFVIALGMPLAADERRALSTLCRRTNLLAPFVDWAVILELASSPEARRYEHLVGLTLPFTWCNPYTPLNAGRVPVEMFYGRRRELDQLLDPNGPTFVYGGRQLGKSALLRRAEIAIHEREVNARGLYLDLNYHGVGLFQPPSQLWPVLAAALNDAGVPIDLTAPARPETVQNAITSWLAGDTTRRLLVLFDECDALLDQDWRDGYRVMQALRGLMDATSRRCKFVLAGLNLVQRFDRGVNQPLAHLTGGNIRVGPLESADAYQLVRSPLESMGIRFEDESLAYKILAATNDQASIIQLVCDALVASVGQKPLVVGAPPTTITRAQLEDLLDDEQLRGEIRRRFEWTIGLDARYQAIAYRVAAEALEGRAQLTVSDLLFLCRTDWPAAFDGLSEEEFRWYLIELDTLGVLRTDGVAWYLRSPNVVELLGSEAVITERLAKVAELDLERRLDPTSLRYPRNDDGAPGPLTADQLRQLLEPSRPATVIQSTELGGANEVSEVLKRVCDDRNLDFTHRRVRSAADLAHRTPPTAGHRRVTMSDLRSLDGAQQQRLSQLALAELANQPLSDHHVLLVSAATSDWADDGDGDGDGDMITLRKWDSKSIRVWFEAQNQPVAAEQVEDIMTFTGGWHSRVAPALMSGTSATDVVGAAERVWQDSGMASEAIEDSGVALIENGARLFGLIEEVGGCAASDIPDLVEMAGGAGVAGQQGVSDTSSGTIDRTVDLLLLCGHLIEVNGQVQCDPYLASAFRVSGGGD